MLQREAIWHSILPWRLTFSMCFTTLKIDYTVGNAYMIKWKYICIEHNVLYSNTLLRCKIFLWADSTFSQEVPKLSPGCSDTLPQVRLCDYQVFFSIIIFICSLSCKIGAQTNINVSYCIWLHVYSCKCVYVQI